MPISRRYLWFIPLLLTIAFGLRRSWHAPPSDFAGYYYGSRALLTGHFTDAYDMVKLNDRIAADGYRGVFVSYTPFPPFTSLVFAPFLVLPMNVAKLVFNLISVSLFLFSLLRVTRYLSTPPYLVLALPFIFFIPLLNNLAFGQSYLLLFALLAEGWLACQKRQRVLSSLLWAAAILFKLFPAFLFLYLLLRRRYRETLYLGIGCALLLVPSLLLNGVSAWHFYITAILPRMNHGELNDSFTYVFQSAFMLLKRAFCYDQLLNPHPICDNPWVFTLGLAVFNALALTPAVWLTCRAKDEILPFTVWIAASMLISPNGSSYSLVLLILPLLGFAVSSPNLIAANLPQLDPVHPSRFPSFNIVPASFILASLVLAAACVIPVNRFGGFPLFAQFPRLYLLLIFYFLLCRSKPRGWNLGPPPSVGAPSSIGAPGAFAALTALFFAIAIRGNLPQKDASSYVLAKEEHLFIDDFTVRNNHLSYSWRDDSGSHEEPTDYPVYSISRDGLILQDNQIWYRGKPITASPDNKAKPALVNGNYIIYLSDKNRGFEFYTLRKVRLDDASGRGSEIRLNGEVRRGSAFRPDGQPW